MSEKKPVIKVLLIDEVDEAVSYFCSQLDRASSVAFDPIILGNMQDACDYLDSVSAAERPEVIALNLAMSGYSSLEALQDLLPNAMSIPIVAISGRDDQELGLKAVRAGAQDYLVMGRFDCELLVRTLRYATERAHAEEEIRAKDREYRALYENVVAGVFRSTLDGRFISANPSMVQLLGYDSEQELLEVDIPTRVYVDPNDRRKWKKRISQAGEMLNSEHQLRRKDGSDITVLETSRLVKGPNSEPSHYQGTLIDVTERVRAERALRESEERFQLAINGSNEGLFDWDLESNHLYASPRLVSIFGFDPSAYEDGLDEILHRAHPDDSRRIRDVLRRHLRDNDVFDVEFRVAEGDDDYRWLQVRGASVRDEKGRATRMVGSVLDIRERKRAELALRESQSFFKLILDSVPISIAYVESDETISFANQQYLDWFHVDRDILIGTRIRDIVTDDDYAIIRPRIDKVLSGETVSYSAAVERADMLYELEVRYIPHHNEQRRIIGFFSVMQDVTENRKLEAELRQAQKMEAIGQLTGGVAHDFNNLLSIIVGNLQLLSRPLAEDERLKGLVESALRASLRGADLTKRLLAMSRRQLLEPQLLDLNETVEAMDELLRRTLDSDIRLVSHFDSDLNLSTIDPGQLENALLNLVINARDAMPEGGTLRISTENMTITDQDSREYPELGQGNYVALRVTDTGVGMTQEQRRQAFEPFYTTKDVGKGSGLGLSMVYGFLEQSGGLAHIKSELDVGTEVSLIFPVATEDANTGEHPMLDSPLLTGNECILVVEDDPDVRITTVALLEELGYQTLEAGDGPSALRVIAGHPEIDLLFTDVMMPGGMRGPVLAKRAGELRPDLPVIFATGFAESTIMHKGVEATLESVICKPFSHEELARKIRRILDGEPSEQITRRA